jgi:hypothetical protein
MESLKGTKGRVPIKFKEMTILEEIVQSSRWELKDWRFPLLKEQTIEIYAHWS